MSDKSYASSSSDDPEDTTLSDSFESACSETACAETNDRDLAPRRKEAIVAKRPADSRVDFVLPNMNVRHSISPRIKLLALSFFLATIAIFAIFASVVNRKKSC